MDHYDSIVLFSERRGLKSDIESDDKIIKYNEKKCRIEKSKQHI